MPRVISLILGGGRGTRLFPLTKSRSKPAVPIAGKYRLIDIPVSNCIHAGLTRIFVLTQFNSVSLHRHIYNTYKFDPFSGGFVEILAAQQTMEHESWYQGTADAVRRNIPYFTESTYDLVLILSGDQLYRMDFQDMIRTHLENKAAVTIAALPVAEQEAMSCGIMKIQADGRVVDFEEKPKTPEKLGRVRTDPGWLERLGLKAAGRPYLASMGIYLFNRSLLVDLLKSSTATDFGHELLPQTISGHRVQAHLFDGYWEDIGTVGAFHQANIELTERSPGVRFRLGGRPDLHAASLPGVLANRRCDGEEQPDLRWHCDRPRVGHREFGDRRAGPDRRQRHDPRHLHHGDRLSRAHPSTGRESANRPPTVRRRCQLGHRTCDHRQERPHRPQCQSDQPEQGTRESEEHPTHVIRDGVVVIPSPPSWRMAP